MGWKRQESRVYSLKSGGEKTPIRRKGAAEAGDALEAREVVDHASPSDHLKHVEWSDCHNEATGEKKHCVCLFHNVRRQTRVASQEEGELRGV